MQAPSIDIAIVNYRCAADTLQALDRLGGWPHGTLWLIDNSAREAEYLAEADQLRLGLAHMPWAKLLAPETNLGFGRACNLAFAQSTSDYFLLLNPDARVAVSDVLELAKTLLSDTQLAAVSPKIYWNEQHSFLLPSAFPQSPVMTVLMALATRSRTATRWAAGLYLRRMAKRMASGRVVEVSFVAGSVLMLRRSSVLVAGGLFDPDYFMFFEDSDLSLRLRRAGYKLAIATTASAVHEYRHKAYKAALMQQSQEQYFRKNHPFFFCLSRGLSLVATFSVAIDSSKWFTTLARPIVDSRDFSMMVGGARVVAFSPSMLMIPTLFRPTLDDTRDFDKEEWKLLEPGKYVAWVKYDLPCSAQWICFEKADNSQG